jgi:ribonuclease PH
MSLAVSFVATELLACAGVPCLWRHVAAITCFHIDAQLLLLDRQDDEIGATWLPTVVSFCVSLVRYALVVAMGTVVGRKRA